MTPVPLVLVSLEHLLAVIRYVERNPVWAKSIPVRKAQRWPWSSIGSPPAGIEVPQLHPGPVPRGAGWLDYVNEPQSERPCGRASAGVGRTDPTSGRGPRPGGWV